MNLATIKKCASYLSNQRVFGVDINNKDLKVFQVEHNKKGKYKIIGWGKQLMPKGVIEDFEVKNTEKFAEILKGVLEQDTAKKIKGNMVILSIPEDKIFLRILTVPLMGEEDVPEAIKWEMEGNIPISLEEVYYDWQIVEKGKKEMKVLVAATPRRIVDSLVESFERLGLHACVLEADSMATGRSLLPKAEKDPVLVVDVGIEGTGYFVYYNGYPVFSSSGSISGQMFTDVVSKHYNLEWKKAEHYKTKTGLGSTKKKRQEALKLYNPLLTTLVQEIEKTVSFCSENIVRDTKKKIEKIIFCGGGSNLKGMLPYLAIHLKRQVIQGNPWENIKLAKGIPPISKEEAQSYVTVIGLALKDYQHGDHH